MASAAIVKTTLHSQAWENAYNIINTRTIVADPLDPENKGFRKFVHKRHPLPSARGGISDSLPYLVVNSPTLRKTTISVDRKLKWFEWEILIEMRTSDSGRRKDKGASDLDSISDDLLNLTEENGDTLRGYDMRFNKIELVTQDFGTEHGDNVFIAEFEFTFKTVMNVT